MTVAATPNVPKNQGLVGKSVGEIAKMQGKGIIDAFLDLAVEEDLQTAFLHGENNVDDDAVAAILNYPNSIIGLSDGGAHDAVPKRLRLLDPSSGRMGA